MLVQSLLQLLVGVDEVLHRLVVRAWVLRRHVALYAPRRADAAIRELLDQVVLQHLGGRRRGYQLLQQLGRGPRLL